MKGFVKIRMIDQSGKPISKIYSNENFYGIGLVPKFEKNKDNGTKVLEDVILIFKHTINNYKIVLDVVSKQKVKELREKYGLNDEDILGFCYSVFDDLTNELINLDESDVFDLDSFLEEQMDYLEYYSKEMKDKREEEF